MIRKMEPSDKQAVIDLAMEFSQERLNDERTYVDPVEASNQFDQFINLPNIVAYVAEENGSVVGMLVLVLSPLIFTSRVVAQEIVWYVNKDHRTCGVRLLKKVEIILKELGCQDIMMTGLDGDHSCDFYERLEYKPFQHSYMKRLV